MIRRIKVVVLERNGVKDSAQPVHSPPSKYLPPRITRKLTRIPVQRSTIASPFRFFLLSKTPERYTAIPIANPMRSFQRSGIFVQIRLKKKSTPRNTNIPPILARRCSLKNSLIYPLSSFSERRLSCCSSASAVAISSA
jgi:hypothetical protein